MQTTKEMFVCTDEGVEVSSELISRPHGHAIVKLTVSYETNLIMDSTLINPDSNCKHNTKLPTPARAGLCSRIDYQIRQSVLDPKAEPRILSFV